MPQVASLATTPNPMFPQNVAEAVTFIFPREVPEEDGDLKKRMIGAGPSIHGGRVDALTLVEREGAGLRPRSPALQRER